MFNVWLLPLHVVYLFQHFQSVAHRCDAGHNHEAVASGFLEVMATLIKVGALSLNPAWLDSQIKMQSAQHARWLADREKRKAAFVTRMKSAREAKQLKVGKKA